MERPCHTSNQAFGAGALAQRVQEEGKDEVAALAASFNRAAQQIQSLVQSNQSLLANASHELRSPLARLKMAFAMLDDAAPAQRQKLAVARTLLRRPDLLILNQSLSALEGAAQGKLLGQVIEETKDRSLIWVLSRTQWARHFERVIVVKGGRIVEQGTYAELDRPGSALSELLKQD